MDKSSNLREVITGEELYTAMEEGIVTEIEISKKVILRIISKLV